MYNLSKKQIEKMHQSAQIVSETMRVLQKSETNIVGEMLKTVDDYFEWEHIPADDVYDRHSHSQYYYHTHQKSEDGTNIHDDEHGHFHSFIRGKGIPEGILPVALPDFNQDMDISDINTHIIGIGMDTYGTPIRLFTVNRWVTGETWYSARDLISMLDSFEIDNIRPSWPVNLWLTHIISMYRPEIEQLILQRDETIKKWEKDHPNIENVYEDRNLEVTSYLNINLLEQAKKIEDQVST